MANEKPMGTAPKDGTDILGWNSEGWEIMSWVDQEEDGPDQPGHNAGWQGIFAFPGRTRDAGFGGADHWIYEPQGQPSCWHPLPEPPTFADPD